MFFNTRGCLVGDAAVQMATTHAGVQFPLSPPPYGVHSPMVRILPCDGRDTGSIPVGHPIYGSYLQIGQFSNHRALERSPSGITDPPLTGPEACMIARQGVSRLINEPVHFPPKHTHEQTTNQHPLGRRPHHRHGYSRSPLRDHRPHLVMLAPSGAHFIIIHTHNNMKYSIKYTPINTTKGIDISYEQVENLYVGNGNQCRCGCGGEYYEPTDAEGEKVIKQALSKMASGDYSVEAIDDYIFEIVIRKERTYRGKNKVMTLYLKK